MNAEIQVFCAKAIGRRLLTVDQCDALVAGCDGDLSLKRLLKVFDAQGLAVDRDALEAIAAEVGDSVIARPARPVRPPRRAARHAAKSVPSAPASTEPASEGATSDLERRRLEWFFFHAIVQGVLTRQVCRELLGACAPPLTLASIAEAGRQQGVFEEEQQLQSLMTLSLEAAESGKWPLTRMLAAGTRGESSGMTRVVPRPPRAPTRSRLFGLARAGKKHAPAPLPPPVEIAPPPPLPPPEVKRTPVAPAEPATDTATDTESAKRPLLRLKRRDVALRQPRSPGTAEGISADPPPLADRNVEQAAPLRRILRARPDAPCDETAVIASDADRALTATEVERAQAMLNLKKPHEAFPFWSCETVYDLVTSMYLETGNPTRVAHELSAARGVLISEQEVQALRKEAASAALHQTDVNVRRKWMWRHRKATVNNLVREYMFLVDTRDFQTAKAELGAEIESLLESVPGNRLLLAINDALGRSDIEWHVVLELVAHHQSGQKLAALAVEEAERRGAAPEVFLKEVAQALAVQERGKRTTAEQSMAYVAWWMKQEHAGITTDDLAYLRGLVASSLECAS